MDMTATDSKQRQRTITILLALLFWGLFLVILNLPRFYMGVLPPGVQRLGWGASVAVGCYLLTLIFAKMQGIPTTDLGLSPTKWSWLTIVAGCVGGFGIVACQILVAIGLMGVHVQIDSRRTFAAVALAATTLFSTATMEELGFRGYPLRRLVKSFGLWSGQLIVALAFALYHHYCYGWDWTRAIVGTGLGSLLFGMAAIASRGLALPIGIHTGVIFALWIFGSETNPGIWKLVPGNPAPTGWIAQAGNVSYCASFLLATFALWMWHRRRIKSTMSARS